MKKLSVIFLAAMLMGCNTQTPDSIKIGVIAPMSGPAGFFGEEVQAIVAHLQTEFPENVEVIIEDGKCSGGDAVTAFNKLTDIDGVDAIFGGICSPESLAIAPLTAQKEIGRQEIQQYKVLSLFLDNLCYLKQFLFYEKNNCLILKRQY